ADAIAPLTIQTTDFEREERPAHSELNGRLLNSMKAKGGTNATPILRTVMAAAAKSNAALASKAKGRFAVTFAALGMNRRHHMEQKKNGASVKGMVECFTTR